MEIRKAAITLKGNPVDLVGTELKTGDNAPDFNLQAQDMSQVTLNNTGGKTRIIASVPSLDTPVCHAEAKRFADEVSKMNNVEMLCVSMDLPMAAKRWCGAEGVENIHTLSDHADASFGKNYGVLINGGPLNRFLARAVFVVGPDNKVKHVEYVPEIAQEPDYAAALNAAR